MLCADIDEPLKKNRKRKQLLSDGNLVTHSKHRDYVDKTLDYENPIRFLEIIPWNQTRLHDTCMHISHTCARPPHFPTQPFMLPLSLLNPTSARLPCFHLPRPTQSDAPFLILSVFRRSGLCACHSARKLNPDSPSGVNDGGSRLAGS